jgi:copper chaperone
MAELTLSVPDVHCAHCKSSLESAVGAVEGVDRVEVTIDAKTLDVSFDDSVKLNSIVAAIEAQGYFVAD